MKVKVKDYKRFKNTRVNRVKRKDLSIDRKKK